MNDSTVPNCVMLMYVIHVYSLLNRCNSFVGMLGTGAQIMNLGTGCTGVGRLTTYLIKVTLFTKRESWAYYYIDVIMRAMASQITGVSIFCSTAYSGADQRRLRVTGFCEGNPSVTGGFPSQRSSNTENVSI